MLNPDDIAFVMKNAPDFQTGQSRGYTIGRIAGRRPDGRPLRIIRETVPDDVGDAIAKVMEERAKTEYGGQLVSPSGDPLNEVLSHAVRVDPETGKALDTRVDNRVLNPDGLKEAGFVHKKLPPGMR